MGGDGNPITASSVLVNAYASDVDRRTGWDFEDESPGNDARGFAREGAMPPMVETHLANTVLTNGARFYVDHAPPVLGPHGGGVARQGGRRGPPALDECCRVDVPRQPRSRRLQEQLRRQG